ncbi:MAG: hypothetical protein KAU62_17255 [Candidatus Heimdallarchaeota archaeon]|nr:hypothetical protein [Candidatus Heimdallarchaeota archaeon]MCK4612907.1 hypothetical protein [Candidatus Heimdallarchaeota archaeon]
MQKDSLLKRIFIGIAVVSIVSNLLMGLGIYFYPGGNFIDNTEEGFGFIYGALSDLGRITAYNGEPNIVSRILYTTAINILSIAVILFYSIIWKFFRERKVTKWLSLVGSLFGITQGILYIVFAFSPADTAFSRHIILIYVSPGFLIGSILVYTIVFFIAKDFPRINAYSFLAMMIVAAMFATAVTIGAIRKDMVFHASRRVGHTFFNFIVTFNYGIQAIGALIYIRNRDSKLP